MVLSSIDRGGGGRGLWDGWGADVADRRRTHWRDDLYEYGGTTYDASGDRGDRAGQRKSAETLIPALLCIIHEW